MYLFLSGAVTMGFAVAALFFFRFWRRMNDQLFAWFGVAFLLLAVAQVLVALADIPNEEKSLIFLIRLGAFAIIIAAVLRKNTSPN
jgi:uncharacterized membrane protein HdeD (DUF308 family)